MKLSENIDLQRSLNKAFSEKDDARALIHEATTRQVRTTNSILERFFTSDKDSRRELVLLADEVGLGKTYVALAVAVSILDAIKQGTAPADLPCNRPCVLILTPRNGTTLFNKWVTEAQKFKINCFKSAGAQKDWFQVLTPRDDNDKGNILDLAEKIRCKVSRNRPAIIISPVDVFSKAIERTYSRDRALATVFSEYRIPPDQRMYWFHRVSESGWGDSCLKDLRSDGAKALWGDDALKYSPDLKADYELAFQDKEISAPIGEAMEQSDGKKFIRALDNLSRAAHLKNFPSFPLIIIDEIHNLKNESATTRRTLEDWLARPARASRLLGLSATPFQLNHDELESVLKLRCLLKIDKERHEELNSEVAALSLALKESRDTGRNFRDSWRTLSKSDEGIVNSVWERLASLSRAEWDMAIPNSCPARIRRTFQDLKQVESANKALEKKLRPILIRHRHNRKYRRYYIGAASPEKDGSSSPNFSWKPGLELPANAELIQYLLMRTISLAKDEKGRAGLGIELTGSYRHLTQKSAAWRRLEKSKNQVLPKYHHLLQTRLSGEEVDAEHPKIQETVRRVMAAFKAGQKSLVFCVFIKTAEALRDRIKAEIEAYMAQKRDTVFQSKGEAEFENFRKRFFNRHEVLYSLIQDHPLLCGNLPKELKLEAEDLGSVATILEAKRVPFNHKKPDRRAILAAIEYVAVAKWNNSDAGTSWLENAFEYSNDLWQAMGKDSWVPSRASLGHTMRTESGKDHLEDIEREKLLESKQLTSAQWLSLLRAGTASEVLAPYFDKKAVPGLGENSVSPLLTTHHWKTLRRLNLETRSAAGQVFRRILMAEEFLTRYLGNAVRESNWANYLSQQYTAVSRELGESLCSRFQSYLETLERSEGVDLALKGYREAAINQNIVQLVIGGDKTYRDRYFLGFNTPYRPEVLITTSVGQEGIDLHKECRNVIHHDLCWNPATIEQRTGRVDRIGSKVEREMTNNAGSGEATLDIHAPYLAASYDERMFEELYRRAQLFEVTLGGDFEVDGRSSGNEDEANDAELKKKGVGALGEDLGNEGDSGVLGLPASLVDRVRVDLSVRRD